MLMKLYGEHKKDVEYVKSILTSDDVIYFDFKINGAAATVVYIDSITDRERL